MLEKSSWVTEMNVYFTIFGWTRFQMSKPSNVLHSLALKLYWFILLLHTYVCKTGFPAKVNQKRQKKVTACAADVAQQ